MFSAAVVGGGRWGCMAWAHRFSLSLLPLAQKLGWRRA
jgi:hypothetical protein